MKRQAEGVPPGQAAAFSSNTELKSSDFGGKRCFWKRPRLHDDIRDSGKGERTARAQQGESASGRPLAKGACPGVGRTGARPKRGRRLDGARDPRRPENPRLPHVGSESGKGRDAGGRRGGGAGAGRATASSPGEAGAEASAEAASPALLGDLGAPCARLRPEGEGGACACAVRGRPAASQTPTRPRPPGAGRVTPALETELLPGRRWGPTDACGDPPLPSKQPLRFPGRIWFAA